MAPLSGIEIWIVAVLCLLLTGPFALAGIFHLITHRARKNPPPPAGWAVDPSGRHELRYWDGGGWTENVRDADTQSTDKHPRRGPTPEFPAPAEDGAEAAGAVQLAENSRPPFWTKRRIAVATAIVVLPSLIICGWLGVVTWRATAEQAATMAELRALVEPAYPDYTIVDSTRSGYVLRHEDYEWLRLDVRLFPTGGRPAWGGVPQEELTDEWSTIETFFRHGRGQAEDPRTDMNYDVAGFAKELEPYLPGPNAVVSAVCLRRIDKDGTERYAVLVARRNRSGNAVEPMWPDHIAIFTRDPETGVWEGQPFEETTIPNWRR